MKIAVFGGGGRTGRFLIEQALAEGHQLAVLARNPERLGLTHEHLRVIVGDAADPAAVAQTVMGSEAVISLLGPTRGQEPFTISRAYDHILAAMRQHGVRRLVITAGAGVGDPLDAPGLADRLVGWLLRIMARSVYEDMLQAVAKVRASDLDWTVARAPMLSDGPTPGEVRAGYLGKGVGMRLNRQDFARFVLQQLTSTQYLRQAPVVSN